MSIDQCEFEILLSKWKALTITTDEFRRLGDCLRNSREYRERFCRIRLDDHLLETFFNKSAESSDFPDLPESDMRDDFLSDAKQFGSSASRLRIILVTTTLAISVLIIVFYSAGSIRQKMNHRESAQSGRTSGDPPQNNEVREDFVFGLLTRIYG